MSEQKSLVTFITFVAALLGLGAFGIVGFFGCALAALLYLLPWLIAIGRRHRSAAAIGVANVLFGWTLLGWGVSIVWAFSGADNSAEPNLRACPMCAEPIQAAAIRCKHCGADVPPQA